MSKSRTASLAACCVVAVVASLVPAAGQTAPQAAETPPSGHTDASGTPRIEFAALEHDFGEALAGDALTTTFRFKNAGDGVLVIEKVKGS